MAKGPVDPITFAVVRHRLSMIGEEQAATLRAVSGSPVVTEANDFNTGIFLADGSMVNMGLHVTVHADCLSSVIRHLLRECSDNPGIAEGDMFINNDPHKGALHQSDFTIVAPVFRGNELVAWVGTTAHQLDVGGMVFGSWCPQATERQQESMIIPLVRFIEGGALRQDIWKLILSMSRLPSILGLDLKAMVAANHVARERLLSLIERYGLETIQAVMEEMIALSERRLRARLLELPDGIFRAVDYIDHDGHENRLYRFSVELTKEDDRLTFDYSGCPPQAPGFINCTESGLHGGVFTALLPILAYDIPWNEGLKRPLSIVAPPGTICNATPPAPTGSATIAAAWVVASVAVRALSLLMGCSDRYRRESQACSSGAFSVLNLAGLNQYGEAFGAMILDPMASGEGAYFLRDGADAHGCFMVPVPNIANVETNENFAPLLYLYRRLIPDTGGPGRQRGGCSGGVAFAVHDVEGLDGLLVAHGVEVPNATGVGGGLPGSCIIHTLLTGSNLRERLTEGRLPADLEELRGERLTLGAKPGRIYLGSDDVFQYTWQGGGGYGDPLERSPEAVLEDVRQGLVSQETAREIYGVVIVPERSAVQSVAIQGVEVASRGSEIQPVSAWENNPPKSPFAGLQPSAYSLQPSVIKGGLSIPPFAGGLGGVDRAPFAPVTAYVVDSRATEELRRLKRDQRLMQGNADRAKGEEDHSGGAGQWGDKGAVRWRVGEDRNQEPGTRNQEPGDRGAVRWRVGEGLGLAEGNGSPLIYWCLGCGHPLGPAGRNWKEFSLSRVVPPTEAGPRVTLHRELELRQFICPGCGLLLGVEVALRGEPFLWEVELDLPL